MSIIDDLRQSVIDGEMHLTQELVQKALAEKIPAEQILKEGLISAMEEVGRRFECDEFYVPEMLISATGNEKRSGIAAPAPDGSQCCRRSERSSLARCRVTCTTLARTWWG